jgi:hypothetical protein
MANKHGATLQSDLHVAVHVALRVKDLTTLPGRSEIPSYCHLLISDLQQAQPTIAPYRCCNSCTVDAQHVAPLAIINLFRPKMEEDSQFPDSAGSLLRYKLFYCSLFSSNLFSQYLLLLY